MFLFLGHVAPKAHSYNLVLDNLSNGYSACSWHDNGNGTSTVRASIDYKESSGHTGGEEFQSRGILIYTYDKNGALNKDNAIARSVTLNGKPSYYKPYKGKDYLMYSNSAWGNNPWKYTSQFIANIEAVIDNSIVSEWPALGIRAGNYTSRADVGEITGAAYISRFGNFGDGSCKVLDPTNPSPPIVAINVTAPDWNLGDLQLGDYEKVFANGADQLCFTYSGAAVSNKNYIINASNANGVVNGRYRLKHLNDASKTVPYNVKLDGGTSTLSLPNASNAAVPLSSSGKTCFVPTFTTTVDELAKSGDYSDVLTFTVVTKP